MRLTWVKTKLKLRMPPHMKQLLTLQTAMQRRLLQKVTSLSLCDLGCLVQGELGRFWEGGGVDQAVTGTA